MTWKNKLYFGDNLEILRHHIEDESVDLIYLDPPFNSQATYNVLYQEKNGTSSAAQIEAFEDTWHWDQKAQATYEELVQTAPKKLSDLVQALYQFLGHNDMMAYLTMMAIRLQELHRVLKPTGSIYLHCDPTASHYLKLVMDAIFGVANYRNEITWKRQTAHSDARYQFADIVDIILFYGKSSKHHFYPQYGEHDPEYLARFYRFDDNDGRGAYQLDNMASPTPRHLMMYEWKGFPYPAKGWRYQTETMQKLHDDGRIYYPRHEDGSFDLSKRPRLKRYLNEQKGQIVSSLWTDIHPISAQAAERLGYPTQKPEALLERILRSSSLEGDIVLDPFCGCGTTISVAERLHRRWVGIDITHLAITLIKRRLEDHFGDDRSDYEVIGDPKDLGGAQALANQDKFQFEWWALDVVGARPAQDKKKGADTGIDGFVYFFDDDSGKAKQVVVQVKSGTVHASQIRDLKGVVEREKAAIGAFVTLQPPTKPMREEAATAGFYESPWNDRKYPKLQILTIEELLHDHEIEMPPRGADVTFKKAEKKEKKRGDQGGLF